MDRIGTKTPGEREDEEIERLVRPSPKVRPPRHDLRRERVEPDNDPDDKPDKDLSRNFKDIGGSVVERVLSRSARSKHDDELERKLRERVKDKGQRVRVRLKETGWVGEVSKEKFKSEPGKYELAPDAPQRKTQPPHRPGTTKRPSAPPKPRPSTKPPPPAPRAQPQQRPTSQPPPQAQVQQPQPQTPPQSPSPQSTPQQSEQSFNDAAREKTDRAALAQLQAMATHDPAFASAMEDFRKPNSHAATIARSKPDYPASVFSQGKQLPEGVKTVGDLVRILNLPAPVKQPSGKQPPTAPTQTQVPPPVEQKPPAEPLPTPQGQEPAAPQQQQQTAPEQAPPVKEPKYQPPPPEEQDLTRIMALPAKAPSTKKEPAAKNKDSVPEPAKGKKSEVQYGNGQPKRPVSSSERAEAIRLVADALPWEAAKQILQASPPYHPDEINELIRDFNVAQALPAEDLDALIAKAPKFLQTDPSKVDPPEGLDDLPEEERATALRKHQVQTVAMSFAVKAALQKRYTDQGVPEGLSATVADFILNGGSPAQRSKHADRLATEVFTSGLTKDSPIKPLSMSEKSALLKSSGDDPALKKVLVAYCQAADYQEARGLYLDPKSKTALTEHQPAKKLAANLMKAAKLLRERAGNYPEGTTAYDASVVFRNRVMKHLASLKPEKAAEVQRLLEEEDNRYYDEQWAKHERAVEAYEHKREKASAQYDVDYKAYSDKLKKGGDPDADPPLNVDERLAAAAVDRPKPPTKPVNYDKLTKKPEELAKESRSLWKKFRAKFASDSSLIRRVAARGSIYSPTCAMDRTAVYWGVDPYRTQEPYEGWRQPHARDLGDSDYTKILTAARKWLKQPVLSRNIEGVVRDTQLRAALDLALRSENYEQAVHPAIYNKLLARLAGVSEKETLLTVRSKTARNPMSKKVELETARADRLLAGLDRIASVVQSNHKKWGMDFRAAKNLVNAIDKIADDLEVATYGRESLLNRQTQEIGREKLAQVLQRDSDEKYMDTFKNPMSPHQTEANEPYMKAYKDDQSSAVRSGKSSTGRPLAP